MEYLLNPRAETSDFESINGISPEKAEEGSR